MLSDTVVKLTFRVLYSQSTITDTYKTCKCQEHKSNEISGEIFSLLNKVVLRTAVNAGIAVRDKANFSFFCFYWLISQCVCSSMNITWYVSAKWHFSYCVKQSLWLIHWSDSFSEAEPIINFTGWVMKSEYCWDMDWGLHYLFCVYEAKDKIPLKNHSHTVLFSSVLLMLSSFPFSSYMHTAQYFPEHLCIFYVFSLQETDMRGFIVSVFSGEE